MSQERLPVEKLDGLCLCAFIYIFYGLYIYRALPVIVFPWIETVHTCHMHIAYVVKEVALFQELCQLMDVACKQMYT